MMINCPECGAENQLEASFCAECGAELTVQPAAADMLPPVEPEQSDDDATILSSRRDLEEALAKARAEPVPAAAPEIGFSKAAEPFPSAEPEQTILGASPVLAPEEPVSEPVPPPAVEPEKSNRLFMVVGAIAAAILSCPCICGAIVALAYISDPVGFEDLLRALLGGSF